MHHESRINFCDNTKNEPACSAGVWPRGDYYTNLRRARAAIIGVIAVLFRQLSVPPSIYKLSADAYQLKIDSLHYPEIIDLSRLYFSS